MIRIIENSDIFDSDADAIVNPVSCIGVRGKGLAKSFKEKYPDNYLFYRHWQENRGLVIGVCLFFKIRSNPSKYIINFPTKNHSKEKSSLLYIKQGLINISNKLPVYDINAIAFPALGCGSGGLDWIDVSKIIRYHFSRSYIDIYLYPPK